MQELPVTPGSTGAARLESDGTTYLGRGLGAVADLAGADDDFDLRGLSRDALTGLYEAGGWHERESRGGARVRGSINRGELDYVITRTWGYVSADCGVPDRFPSVSEQSLLQEPVEFRLLLKCFMQGSSMEWHQDGWYKPYLPDFDLRRFPPELLEYVPALKVRVNEARTVLGILTISVDSTHFPCVIDVPTHPGCCVVRNYHPKRSRNAALVHHVYARVTRLWKWFPNGETPCGLTLYRVRGGLATPWDLCDIVGGLQYADELVIVTGSFARSPEVEAALPDLLRKNDASRC